MNDLQFNLIWVALVWMLYQTEDTMAAKAGVVTTVIIIASMVTLLSTWIGL